MSDQTIDTRIAMYAFGVDYGADAKVLLVKGLKRLVWSKGTKTLIGIKGLGTLDAPCTLQIRGFKRDKDRIVYDGSIGAGYILVGGRLSKARLLGVKETIDKHFGVGATDMLDPRRTVLMDGRDEVHEWLKSRNK